MSRSAGAGVQCVAFARARGASGSRAVEGAGALELRATGYGEGDVVGALAGATGAVFARDAAADSASVSSRFFR